MEIHINEDGSATVTTAGYTAFYDKEGRLKTASSHLVHTTGDLDPAPQRLTDILSQNLIKLASRRKAAKEQASKTYDAGMKLSVDTREAKSAADILDEVGKAFERTEKAYLMSAGISYANKDN
ncbi:hypothetical protein KKJ09_22125, partial [Xenorhabdus bovienii]|uniref:hypothetical protein n=2 Tax=Xenorhabdus bovienii TaxID=40576 RepID=UPI0023B31D51